MRRRCPSHFPFLISHPAWYKKTMNQTNTIRTLPATQEHRARAAERGFVWGAGGVYLVVSLALMVTLRREWVANVDVQTFLAAARTFWDGGAWFDLYQVSRESSPWPFAYPPLFAVLIAPFVALADTLFGVSNESLPALIAMRIPIWLIDIGIAALISRTIQQQTKVVWLGRVGALLWLFSPILFYHSTIQAHPETLWLLPILLAYHWIQAGRRDWRVMVLFAIALMAKQTAVLFALPFGLLLLAERRWRGVLLFPLMVVGLFGAISLPFFLHGDDYRYMVFEFVGDMAVQVQSWQVWSLAFESYRLDQVRTTFPTVDHVLYLTLGVTFLLSVVGLVQRRSWYTIGLMMALGFFLTAHKAIGYHYPLLLLWLILYGLTERHYPQVTFALGWTTWVLLSPYYADWVNPDHLAGYALLGTLNSIYYLYFLINLLRSPNDGDLPDTRTPTTSALPKNHIRGATVLLMWGALYFWGFVLAGLANPIRYVIQDQIPDSQPLQQLGALIILLLVLLWLSSLLTRPLAAWLTVKLQLPNAEMRPIRWTRAHTGVWLAFGVLFFTWFTMNAEITRLFERGLWVAWGLD
jgi:hypothetical protein